jgi:hypothetical protein
VHGIGGDQEEIRSAALEPACSVDHHAGGRVPAAGMLQGFDLSEIERPHQATGRVGAAQPLACQLVEDAVILRGAFPAQAADQPDDFLLLHA